MNMEVVAPPICRKNKSYMQEHMFFPLIISVQLCRPGMPEADGIVFVSSIVPVWFFFFA